MNIGIDFDNTITVEPRFFKRLATLMGGDSSVYIISSYEKGTRLSLEGTYRAKARQLKNWGISYKRLDLVREPISENKARLCNKYRIEIMIDDRAENVKTINRMCRRTVCLQFVPAERLP